MDQDALVADLKKLAEELNEKQGPLALFMLEAPDFETGDRWNIVVSARGLDDKSRADAIRHVTESIREIVSEGEWHRIARATVLRTNDPFVRAMNSTFRAEHEVINLQPFSISGVDIPRAVLLESKPVAA